MTLSKVITKRRTGRGEADRPHLGGIGLEVQNYNRKLILRPLQKQTETQPTF